MEHLGRLFTVLFRNSPGGSWQAPKSKKSEKTDQDARQSRNRLKLYPDDF